MRIWDLPPEALCRQHLLGEHQELHGLWVILTQGKKGFSRHPETLRWQGKLKALFLRHERLVQEMRRRGYVHSSPLDPALATGEEIQRQFKDPLSEQIRILKRKGCSCRV